MPTPDFDKIWASTSPLTPYSFSESNYKEGWNFIGGTPPARQMWDAIQKNNDEKAKALNDLTQDLLNVDDDFFTNLLNKFASNFSLPADVTFPSASIFSQMVSEMNTEDGVVYDLSNSSAWYICLGAKYGNLIIQGGKFRVPTTTSWTEYPLPISFTDADYSILGTMGATNGVVEAYSGGYSKFNYKALSFSGGTWTNEPLHWLAVGH